MANFVVCVDKNKLRSQAFFESVQDHISLADHLTVKHLRVSEFSAVWASGEHTPESVCKTDSDACVLWGLAMRSGEEEETNAVDFLKEESGGRSPSVFDGFYAAVSYKAGVLRVCADLLGLFPVYYYQGPDFVLVASSIDLFRHHPGFNAKLSYAGLIGILLTNGLLEGKTLLQDVCRLDPGNYLESSPELQLHEKVQFELPADKKDVDGTFDSHVEELHEAIALAVKRHCKKEHQHSLLLSGGVDSRTLLGYMTNAGVSTTTMTLGMKNQHDAKFAIKIAKACAMKHALQAVDHKKYIFWGERQAQWESLADGFSNVWGWSVCDEKPTTARTVTGHLLGSLAGGPRVTCFPDSSTVPVSFERFFKDVNRWGVPKETIKELFDDPYVDELVENRIGFARKLYESYSENEFDRAHKFEMHHRERYHVGGLIWKLSFGSWPVLPWCDASLLRTVLRFPAATLGRRRLQHELLIKKFPALADIPLDVNSKRSKRLTFHLKTALVDYANDRVRFLLRVLLPFRKKVRTDRFYEDLYDFNGAGWQSLRKEVLDMSKADILNPAIQQFFNRCFSKPEEKIHFTDPIVDSSGLKLVLGFGLWCKKNRGIFRKHPYYNKAEAGI